MKSIIEELWYGNIAPCDNCGVKVAEIEELVALMGENEDILRKELCSHHKMLFQKYVTWSDKYTCCISACAFRDGFRLAAKIFAETLLSE